MKNHNLLAFFLLAVSFTIQSQENIYETYSWDANPDYSVSEDETAGIVGIKDNIISEFSFLDEGLVEYFLEHKVFWLNSDDKIEQFNKIYLPYSGSSELLKSKARVISPSGKITELDESKILTAEDEETKRTVKYFALEGIEKGGFVEYWYALRRFPKYQGEYIRLQDEFKKQKVSIQVVAPENLVFEFKSFNGLKPVGQPEKKDKKLFWTIAVDNMEALDREDVSAYDAKRKAIAYKLYKNTTSGATGMVSYEKFTQNVSELVNQEYSKRTLRDLDKFLKKGNIQKKEDKDQTIRDLDNYIKSSIYFVEAGNDNLKDLEFVIENKAGTDYGLIQLYMQSLEKLDIDYQIVLTSDRTEKAFDKDFEALDFLQHFLIYFPETEKYLEPGNQETRYGFPDFNLTDNYGLFIKKVKIGDFESLVGNVDYIESTPAEASTDKMSFEISFNEDDPIQTTIDFNHSISGYTASYVQPYLSLMKDDAKENFYEAFIKRMNENITIEDKTVSNVTSEDFGVNPLSVEATVTSEAFVDKAGRKYLFKVGELIGLQTEMYQEKKRKLPVDNRFRKRYLRTITVNIPEGYKITNLDDIKILEEYKEDGKTIMNFDSSYQLDGNTLTITANEIYDENLLPVDLYETYRKIINSAADFNKLTLIMEPAE